MILRNADRTIWRMFEEDREPFVVVQSEVATSGPPFERREKSMTYCKYSYFSCTKMARNTKRPKAGTAAPFSGIYYCEACGGSITSLRSQSLPSQDHHPHTPAQGPVRWRLAVNRIMAS